MDTEKKHIIKRVIAISLVVLLIDYLITSVVGTFYFIILSYYGLKYVKENNLFGVKAILTAMIFPTLFFIFSIF